jgi:hypothetical protein
MPIVRCLRFLALIAGVFLVAPPVRAEPSVAILPLGFAVGEFRAPASRVSALIGTTDALRDNKAAAGQPLVVVWGKEGGAALALKDGAIVTLPLGRATGDIAALERGRDAVPGSRVQSAGPLTVTLTQPTSIYPHDALGSAVHAGAVTISERRPVEPGPDPRPVPIMVSRLEAGPGAVFEDRAPRLADLDGDGTPEVVTIKSYRDRGAALAIIAKRDGRWNVVAETPPIGEPQLWLNPAGIADFQGTGQPQIALVRTPHREGVVEIWAYESGKLVRRAEKAGYSNHASGQTAQDLAAVVDLGGGPALAIPSLDRRSLAILSFKGGTAEHARIALPAPVLTGVAVLGQGRDAHILVGLEDGRVADVRP